MPGGSVAWIAQGTNPPDRLVDCTWPLSAACGCQTVRTPEEKIAKSNIPREFNKVSMPDYVVEPPDLLLVEVLEALPGRPISGERLVRPDGKISLGFYGEVYVAGLTIPRDQGEDRPPPPQVPHRRGPRPDRAGPRDDGKTTEVKPIEPKDSRPGLRGRDGVQQQDLLRPGRRRARPGSCRSPATRRCSTRSTTPAA